MKKTLLKILIEKNIWELCINFKYNRFLNPFFHQSLGCFKAIFGSLIWEQPHPLGSYSEYFLTQKQQTSS